MDKLTVLSVLCVALSCWAVMLASCRASALPLAEERLNSIWDLDDDKDDAESKQFLLGVGKETSTPDFVRLVVMRLIYGLASTMGFEERLEGAFNGAFVPPNADGGDLFGLGGLGDDDDSYVAEGLDGIFDDGDDLL